MSDQNTGLLANSVAGLAGLEKKIEINAKQLASQVSGFPEVSTLLGEIQVKAVDHGDALRSRLQALGGAASVPDRSDSGPGIGELLDADQYPATTALRGAYALLNQAVVEYAMLQVLALRHRDSWASADDGTTGHIAREHTQDCAVAIQQICRLLHSVLVREMEKEGLECQCTCPSCGLGICLCAAASRAILNDAWAGAGPVAVAEGVYVQTPKAGSAAEQAGLRRGDIVVGVGDEEVQEYSALQAGVRSRSSGEEIPLVIRRVSDVTEEISVARP